MIIIIINFCATLLNRARLFMHTLQCQRGLSWDATISDEQKRDWKNICKQLNNAKQISIPRFICERSDSYNFVAFTDSSS